MEVAGQLLRSTGSKEKITVSGAQRSFKGDETILYGILTTGISYQVFGQRYRNTQHKDQNVTSRNIKS